MLQHFAKSETHCRFVASGMIRNMVQHSMIGMAAVLLLWLPFPPGPNFCHWDKLLQQWVGWTATGIDCNLLNT